MRLNITIQKYDKPLLFTVLFLSAFGTIMLYSASWNESYIRSGGLTESLFLEGHLKRITLGFLCLFAFLIIDYRNLKPIAPYLLTISFFLLIITKGYYLVKGINSPARWLHLGVFSIQTSDIARLSLIIFLAYYLDEIKMQIKNLYNGFLPCIIMMGVMMAFIVIQPDFSTAFMVGAIGMTIIFIAGAKISHIGFSILVGILMGIPIIYFKPYRLARILSWFDETDIQTNGYQAHQALIAFIFIFYRGIKISQKCTDPFGIFLAIGICTNIVLYGFVNAAVATGLFPVTGLPMPMISYGGSGMLVNMIMVGILLNISQAKRSIGSSQSWSNLNFG